MTEQARKFQLGDRVTKTKGSNWTGRVVGFYSTSLTPIGYAVESETEKGSVQIYPEQALRAHGQARPVEDPELCYHTDVARPTFEGDEAEVRNALEARGEVGRKALALLDAKDTALKTALDREAETIRRYDKRLDAKDAEIRSLENMVECEIANSKQLITERDEALAAKERAEQALAETNQKLAITTGHMMYAQEALAERDAAIVAWLRKDAIRTWGADCTGRDETTFITDAIEAGEWK